MAQDVIKNGIEDVKLFGDTDINKHGRRGSEMPSWYFRAQKEELENNISVTKGSLARGEVREDMKPQIIADLKRMEEKLDKINADHPVLKGGNQDAVKKVSDSLGSKIAEAMYTRSDMMRGVADAHEEARRMSEPCIELRGDEMVLAKKSGCRISNEGKVSRTDAERVWKIARRALGEQSNTEVLRRG